MKKILGFAICCCIISACQKELLDTPEKSGNGNEISMNKAKIPPKADTILVAGAIDITFVNVNLTPHGIVGSAKPTYTGDLTGNGVSRMFSSQVTDTSVIILENETKLFTSSGNLFFSDKGIRIGNDVWVTSTITGGTGLYKDAKGQLDLIGLHGDTGLRYTYTGMLILQK